MIPFIAFGSLFMAFAIVIACRCVPKDKDDDDTDYTDPFFR